MHTVTKQYRDLPAAHRQHTHAGHCRWIHGHNWGFDITFACRDLDACGFVVDVGGLGTLRRWLQENFDHTLLLNLDDPQLKRIEVGLETLAMSQSIWLAKVVVVPNCGMEGLSKLVYSNVNTLIQDHYIDGVDRGLICVKVVCWEDSKNSATYEPS